ncbi:polymorphic toxin-type HINT domain-containing protein [Streptomyces albidoflavus]|uniref:polymorphic toxin-type HINT domain-containing protein n=1 Tax=Streptomyces albidoflavus TaxID=1886 RepID=UPI003D0C05C9
MAGGAAGGEAAARRGRAGPGRRGEGGGRGQSPAKKAAQAAKTNATETAAKTQSGTKSAGGKGPAPTTLTATDGHPFWVPQLDTWIDAADLNTGQYLRTSAGTRIQITAITQRTTQATVHNLTVAGTHTYYVVARTASVLVHNCGEAELQSELTQLGKARIEEVKAGLSEGESLPGAFSVGRDRTTGKTYYGESGPATDHHPGVTSRLPGESQLPNGRPLGVCAEARMCTNSLNDGASLENLDVITLNQKGKKFKMCPNCQSWVSSSVGNVLTG